MFKMNEVHPNERNIDKIKYLDVDYSIIKYPSSVDIML